MDKNIKIAKKLVKLAKSLVASNDTKTELENRFLKAYASIIRKAKEGGIYTRLFTFVLNDGKEILVYGYTMAEAIDEFCNKNPNIASQDIDCVKFPVSSYTTPVILK